MKSNTTLFSIIFTLIYSVTFSQTWIDKNEDTNYVRRHECSFVQSGDTFIMFGGREQAKRLDIYNYTTNSWSQGAQAPIEFNHFQATEYDGLIWVVGAFQTNNFPNEEPAENVYIYNPALDYWIKGVEVPLEMRRGGAGLVIRNDKFYLVAGNTIGHNGGFSKRFDVYDPLNNTWDQLDDAPRGRDHFAAAIIENKLYAASGRRSGGIGGVFAPVISEVDVYDFVTNSWSTLASSLNIPTARAGASVVNFNDELFVIGGEGENSGPAFKKVEAFNPVLNSWTTKADLNFARHGTQAIVSGNGIFITGGSPVQGGGRQHNMEVYNIDSPIGVSVSASTLNASSSELNFEGIETKDLMMISSGGNAGNYITNVMISGVDASSFTITSNLKDHLIKATTSQNLSIVSNTTEVGKSAILTITYDNDKTIIVNLNTIDPPVFSVSDLSTEKNDVSVYPLPVSSFLKVETEKKIKISEVYDLNGRLIHINNTIEGNKNNILDFNMVDTGVYLLKLELTSGEIYYRRILKR